MARAARLLNGLTIKQDTFARLIVKGLTGHAAYRQAYDCEKSSDATVDCHASQLVKQDKIATRIVQLQELVATAAGITPDVIAAELVESRDEARNSGQHGAAIKATELRGDMIDAFHKRDLNIDQRNLNVNLDASVYDKMSLDELQEGLEALRAIKALKSKGSVDNGISPKD